MESPISRYGIIAEKRLIDGEEFTVSDTTRDICAVFVLVGRCSMAHVVFDRYSLVHMTHRQWHDFAILFLVVGHVSYRIKIETSFSCK